MSHLAFQRSPTTMPSPKRATTPRQRKSRLAVAPALDVVLRPVLTCCSFRQGGYNVWWDISQPDENCAILIYQAYSQQNYTANWGNVILETSRGGCFYAEMNGGQWASQFCCGNGDCGAVQPGSITTTASNAFGSNSDTADNFAVSQSSNPKVSSSNTPWGNSTANNSSLAASGTAVAPLGTATTILKNSTQTNSSTTGGPSSPASKRYIRPSKLRRDSNENWCTNSDLTDTFSCVDYPWTPAVNCGTAKPLKSYNKAAVQQQVTDAYFCGGVSACSITHGTSVTLTSTLTNEHSVTNSQSNSISVSIDAGVDILESFDAGISTTYTHDWTKAIESSSSISNATAYMTTNTWSYSQVPGTYGYLWFTGTFNCELLEMTCNNQPVTVEKCVPATLSGSQEPEGDVGFVTIGQ